MRVNFFIFLVVCCGCGAPEAPPTVAGKLTDNGHTTDGLDVVKASVESGKAVLIDVREQSEWDDGHLKDARLIPMSVFKSGELTAEMKESLPKEKPVYLHCLSGGRVLKVAEILKADGYDVRPLQAGYSDLLQEGFAQAK